MKGKFFTDRGKVRGHNEDSGGIFCNLDNQPLFIVADGMGGHQAGEVASGMATDFVRKTWEETEAIHEPEDIKKWLEDVLSRTNRMIYDQAKQEEAYRGMGTTVVIGIFTDDRVTVAHIGDSRCYLHDKNGFEQITEDHSLVSALVRSGQISKEEAKYHPHKNVVLKVLGTDENVQADIRTIERTTSGLLLLCSDGLTDKLSDDELEQMITDQTDIETLGNQMIECANVRGGEDNVSLIITSFDGEKEGDSVC